jgi:hypothetical protein
VLVLSGTGMPDFDGVRQSYPRPTPFFVPSSSTPILTDNDTTILIKRVAQHGEAEAASI